MMYLGSIFFTILVVLIIPFIRNNIVCKHRNWVIEYMKALRQEYLNREEKRANDLLIEGSSNNSVVVAELKERIRWVCNIYMVYNMYPSYDTMVFSLDKWTRKQFFPNLELNMALALSNKLEDIDRDLMK